MDTVKCNRCMVKLPVNKFETKRCGTLKKLCIDCNLKNKNRFKCVDCDAKFSINSKLQAHINGVHLKLKPFKCSQCDAKFDTNRNLQRHINSVHLKIQPFQCSQCDLKFSENRNLQQHINAIHLKLQPFTCLTCDAKFSSNGDLQKHINAIHLKLQPFTCEACASKFGVNENLQRHIRIVHLKLQPFECLTCKYKFSQNSHLQSHMKICTGGLNCSAGEYKIMKVLADLDMEKNENYLYNTSFWNVRDKILLRWDFIVNHNENPMVIEFDGQQHYEAVKFGGISEEKAHEKFENSKRRDKIKDDHCLANNIPILRISYLDNDNIEKLVKEFLHKDSSVSTT